MEFSSIVTSEAELRSVLGHPSQRVLKKQLPALDAHCRAFIANSPFLLIATADAQGNLDISPKGDPGGFARVLDDTTLAIPDRPGNRRADTFGNLLQNPQIGLLFVIPGKQETLRVAGNAMIVRDHWLREQMAIGGKLPDLALVVKVREAFFHCAKCVIRSRLWDSGSWPDATGLASLAQVIVDQAKPAESVEEMQAFLERDVRERLY
ncbi:MAG TPA: pyridoxamine 5'-phosphate oxidase family protein [Burkholderiales bacterium]|nr:pyridoxamine 5'-phosphate oxidase family protein [Burkholderiales bacterium]